MKKICTKQLFFLFVSLFILCPHVTVYSGFFGSFTKNNTNNNNTDDKKQVPTIAASQSTIASHNCTSHRHDTKTAVRTKKNKQPFRLETKILSLENGLSFGDLRQMLKEINKSQSSHNSHVNKTATEDKHAHHIHHAQNNQKMRPSLIDQANVTLVIKKLRRLEKENLLAFNELVLIAYLNRRNNFDSIAWRLTPNLQSALQQSNIPATFLSFAPQFALFKRDNPEKFQISPELSFLVTVYVTIDKTGFSEANRTKQNFVRLIDRIQKFTKQKISNKNNHRRSSHSKEKKKSRRTSSSSRTSRQFFPRRPYIALGTSSNVHDSHGRPVFISTKDIRDCDAEYEIPLSFFPQDLLPRSQTSHQPPSIVARYPGIECLINSLKRLKQCDYTAYVDVVFVSHYNAIFVYDQQRTDHKPLALAKTSYAKIKNLSLNRHPILLKDSSHALPFLFLKKDNACVSPPVCYLIAQLTEIALGQSLFFEFIKQVRQVPLEEQTQVLTKN